VKFIIDKWWDSNRKHFGITNFRKSWRENGNKPRIDFWTNGAIKGRHSCLDVTLIIGYAVFNYTNFDYSRQT
jgi:hypothetical protein